jgi:hypothetical protein
LGNKRNPSPIDVIENSFDLAPKSQLSLSFQESVKHSPTEHSDILLASNKYNRFEYRRNWAFPTHIWGEESILEFIIVDKISDITVLFRAAIPFIVPQ